MEQIPETLLRKGILLHRVKELIYPFRVRAYRTLRMLWNFRDVANVQIFQMLPTFSVANVAVLSRCCRVAVPSNVAVTLQGSLFVEKSYKCCRKKIVKEIKKLKKKRTKNNKSGNPAAFCIF